MIEKLRIVVDKLLISSNNKDRLNIIKDILKDDKCFFKMDIDTAFNILNDLGFNKEESMNIYSEIIDSSNYGD